MLLSIFAILPARPIRKSDEKAAILEEYQSLIKNVTWTLSKEKRKNLNMKQVDVKKLF
jgi:hypothetical protein